MGSKPEKDLRLENARRLYESLCSAGFTDETFRDLGEKGQSNAPFRALLPDTIRALIRTSSEFIPALQPSRRKGHGASKTKEKEEAAETNTSSDGPA